MPRNIWVPSLVYRIVLKYILMEMPKRNTAIENAWEFSLEIYSNGIAKKKSRNRKRQGSTCAVLSEGAGQWTHGGTKECQLRLSRAATAVAVCCFCRILYTAVSRAAAVYYTSCILLYTSSCPDNFSSSKQSMTCQPRRL